uniref:Uncharacterized protein n=1 Tax=Oryza nivara TaxID=4536 RepID=A0A0E0IAL5_ORYNI
MPPLHPSPPIAPISSCGAPPPIVPTLPVRPSANRRLNPCPRHRRPTPLPTSSAIRPSPPARRRSLAAGSPNRRNRPHTSAAAHPGHRPSPVVRSPFIPQPDPVATPSRI